MSVKHFIKEPVRAGDLEGGMVVEGFGEIASTELFRVSSGVNPFYQVRTEFVSGEKENFNKGKKLTVLVEVTLAEKLDHLEAMLEELVKGMEGPLHDIELLKWEWMSSTTKYSSFDRH